MKRKRRKKDLNTKGLGSSGTVHKLFIQIIEKYFNPMLLEFESLNDATLKIEKWLVSKLFANIFHHPNFSDVYK